MDLSNRLLPSRHKDVAKTSQKRLNFGLQDVLDWSEMEVATTCLEDVVKTSSRRRSQDVLPGDVLKTSSRRRPQDIFQETPSRRLPADVLKTILKSPKTSRLFLVRAKDQLKTI